MEVGKHSCPHCGKVNDRVSGTGPESKRPSNGDVGICFSCVRPFFFVVSNDDISTRKATKAEESELARDETVVEFMLALKKAKLEIKANEN